MEVRVGVVHGRFQPLHLGHMEYLLAGLARCELLLVGLANPEPGEQDGISGGTERNRVSSNPFSYFNRLEMVRNSLLDFGVARDRFEIVPFPINSPERLHHYLPHDAVHFITIYDTWGDRKHEALQNQGYNVEVLWRRSMDTRAASGTDIRARMAAGLDWKQLVPVAVAKVIEQSTARSQPHG